MRKPIPSLPGYCSDHHGNIWSAKPGRYDRFKKPHRITAWRGQGGYLRVALRPRGESENHLVHVLVAKAFNGDCPAGFVCCHLNGNNADNRPGNLKYVTQKENIGHKRLHGTIIEGERSPFAKLSDADAAEVVKLSSLGELTQREIARRFGINESTVHRIRTGRIRKHLFGGVSLPVDDRPAICFSGRQSKQRNPIPDFPGYEADQGGNIYSVKLNVHPNRWKPIQLLRTHSDRDGYREVRIKGPLGKYSQYKVHRLVASAWIGCRPDGYLVHHRNANRSDNRVANLEYVTAYHNVIHRETRKRKLREASECS